MKEICCPNELNSELEVFTYMNIVRVKVIFQIRLWCEKMVVEIRLYF